MKKRSEFGKLKTTDFWKGLLLSVIIAIFTSAYDLLESATDFTSFQWQRVAISALIAFVGYITKNLFTNSAGQVLRTEKPES